MFRMILTSALAAAAVAAVPAAAGDTVIGLTYGEVVHSYSLTGTAAGRGRESEDARVARQLASLERLCAKDDWVSVRRCNESWRVINRAHARLQARKAAASSE